MTRSSEFVQTNYDRINLQLPYEMKRALSIKAHANLMNLTEYTRFILRRALDEDKPGALVPRVRARKPHQPEAA